MALTYLARRVITGAVIAQELPLDGARPKRSLSATDTVRGTLPATDALRLAADGHPIMEQWGTELYALDAMGRIVWGGLVHRVQRDGEVVTIEASGMSGYPTGIRYAGAPLAAIQIDPADAVRHLWAHVQSYPGGQLGVVVEGSTPVRIGTASDQEQDTAQKALDDAQAALDAANATLKTARELAAARRATYTQVSKTAADRVRNAQGTPAKDAARAQGDAEKAAAKAQVDAAAAAVEARDVERGAAQDARDARREELKESREQAREDGGAYRLEWWNNTDCGAEVKALAEQTPFDYTEHHEWDGESIRHRLRIHYPRAGGSPALSLEQGVNIIEAVTVVADGESYANEVTALGAGEGAGSLRATVSEPDWRLRRTTEVIDPSITNRTRLTTRARAELRAAQAVVAIESALVIDHPHAPLNSISLGDDLPVTVTTKSAGTVTRRSRVIGVEYITDTLAVLTFRPSDSYTYGSTT